MLATRCSAQLSPAQRQPVAMAFASGVRHLRGLPCIPELVFAWQRTPARKHIRCLASSASRTSSVTTNDTAAAPLKLQSGQIHVIFGPMFAGKSSELLRRISEFEAKGQKVALVKSDRDNRYSANEITTHDGISRSCHAVSALADVKEALGQAYDATEVIAIDEAQFFPDLLQFCAQAADHEGKQVLVAGLDGDFRRARFGQVLDLVPMSDSVTKLTAHCAYCTNPALFSLRIAADQRQEVVGGADKYAPVCRHHFTHLEELRTPS